MTINIMNEYIELTKKNINLYLKLIFGKKFKKEYCDAYTEKYINIRYYNFYDNNDTIRRRILEHLKQTEEGLTINNIQDRDIIEKMRIFFYYVLYFDDVAHYKDLENIVKKISGLRIKLLNSNNKDLEEKLCQNIYEWFEKKEELLQKFESDIFFIKTINYKDKMNVYKVKLKYNIEFPEIYSEFAIKKAFNLGVVNEDKLIIEYYLTVIKIIRDIQKLNFKRKYIVWFSDTLLNKTNKLKQILNIIDNYAIQDKICLKIRYEHFIKNKEKIYELMRRGYNITIILDKSFNADFKNIETLKIFKFVIVSEESQQYEELKENGTILQNIIIV